MIPILVAFLGLASQVAAQSTGRTTAVCTYAQWTSFRGNTPCQIWANLQAACDPNASVGVLNTTFNPTAQYPSPSGSSATPCQCNVVAYNLMAGCSWCQPNVYSQNWMAESQWRAGCSDYNPSGLPSQASSLSSQIPLWAFSVDNGRPWLSFDASSIAAAGITPTATVNSRTSGGFATGTATGFATGFPGFTTNTRLPAATGHVSGGDFDPSTVDLGKTIGIPVGIILGCNLIFCGIALAVFFTRQKNRQAWYGPTAKFYRDGGRMVVASQPPLSPNVYGQEAYNPFTTPSPGTSPATAQYDQNLASPATAQYDQNLLYDQGGQGYGQHYQQAPAVQQDMYQTGNQQHVIHV